MMRNHCSVLAAAALALSCASIGPAGAEAAAPKAGVKGAATRLPAPPPNPATRRAVSAQNLPTPIVPAARGAQIERPGTLDAKQRALVERINIYLTSVHTLIGDFVQVGPDGRRTEGKFYLQKPGRMRFEYNDPNPLELIADGKSVAIRDRRLATQDLLLLSQTPLRFLLSERIDLLKEGNLVNVLQDDAFITVVIDEKQTLGGTHRLMLMFSPKDSQLKQWTVTDPQGYDTTVALYNIDTSRKPDPSLFRINYERFRD